MIKYLSKKIFIVVTALAFSTFNTQGQCPVKAIASNTIINCGDSVSLTATINIDRQIDINFDQGADSRLAVSSGAVYDNPCTNSKNPNQYLWFSGGVCPRSVTTNSFNLTDIGTLCFSMRYAAQGGTAPCEGVDAPNEGVYLQYSIDNGTNWISIDYFDPDGGNNFKLTNWNEYCYNIPLAARTSNTLLRWIQLEASLPVQPNYDHWGLEDIYLLRDVPNTFFKWLHTGVVSASAVTPKVAPNKDTTYTVRYYVNGDSCESSVFIDVILPEVTIVKSTDNVCPGTPVQLLAISSQVKELPKTCGINNTGPGCDELSTSSEIKVGSGSTVFPESTNETFGGQQVATSRSQYLILASELIAQGFKGGQINSLGFTVANINDNFGDPNPNGFEVYNNFKLRIKCVSKSNVGTTLEEAGFSDVYAPRDLILRPGQVWIYFDQTYNWDGVSNILLDMCWYDNNDDFRHAKLVHHSTAYNSRLLKTSNGNYGNYSCLSGTNPAASASNNRPNFNFGICTPAAIPLEYIWSPTKGLSDSTVKNPIATPDETTTYTVGVYFKGRKDCITYESVTVNTSNPKTVVTPIDTNLCPGQSVQITTIPNVVGNATIPTTFTYTNPNPNDTIRSRPNTSTGAFNGVEYPQTVAGVNPPTLSANSVVEVCIDIDHPRMSEITLRLISPSGVTVNLVTKRGGNTANFKGCLSDFAPVAIATGTGPFAAKYTPEQPLAGFAGGNPNGTWRLVVIDDATQVTEVGVPPTVRTYTGKIKSWSITLNNVVPNFVKSYSWSPAAGLSATNIADPVANPSTSTEYTLTLTDGNNCITTRKVNVNVGTSNDIPVISSNSPICTGDSLKLFTNEIASVYTWNGPNGFTSNDQNPVIPISSSANAGDYTLQLTSAEGCLSGIATIPVVINSRENANFDYGTSTICQTGSNPTPTKEAGVNGLFTAVPAGLNFVDASTGEIDLTTTSVGTYTITYATNGTCNASVSKTITVTSAPDASFGYSNTNYCVSESNPSPIFPIGASAGTFSATPTGISFVDITNGIIDLKNSAPGNYTVKNFIAANGACAASEFTTNVEIIGLPDAGFSLSNNEICISENPVTITLNTTGGTLTGTGVSGTIFDPQIAGIGVHEIKYVLTVNGCTDSSKQTIRVNPLPDPAFTGLNATYCESEGLATLTPTTQGGVFSGAGIFNNFFNPGTAGVGTHSIKYVVTNSLGCSDSSFFTVNVDEAPDATFNGLQNDYCQNDGLVELEPVVSGGTFSGNGVSGTTFNPSAAGPGTHIIKYEVSNNNNCTDSSKIVVTVHTNYDSDFAGLNSSYCIGNDPVVLTPVTSGGTFIGKGISGNIFDPSVAGEGTHFISYAISDNGFCPDTTTYEVRVNPLPDANFTGLKNNYCVSDGNVTLTPSTAGGTFKGKGVTGNSFSPQVAGIGSFTIKYIVSNAEGCVDSSTFGVTVNALPNSNFNGLATKYCEGDAIVTLTPTVTGGTFSGPGIEGNTFDPSAAGLGTHTIKYVAVNAAGCKDSTSKQVTINEYPEFVTSGNQSICNGGTVQIGTSPINGITYRWTPTTGLSNASISNPSASPTQTTTYTLTSRNAAGCEYSEEVKVTVNPLPIADFEFTIKDKVIDCKALTSNGITSWTWDFGDRSPLQSGAITSHTYLQCNDFNVKLTVESPCGTDVITKKITSCKDSVSEPLSVNEIENGTFKVSPNPFVDQVTIQLTKSIHSNISYQLINDLGQVIETNTISKNQLLGRSSYTLDLRKKAVSTGLYFLILQSNDGSEVIKLQKN